MALTIMKVSLRADSVLDVEDLPHPGIPCGQGVQVIVWVIDPVTLPNASFGASGSSAQGFTWINAPPPRVFSKPRVTSDGQRILLDDDHVSTATGGKWVYMLQVLAVTSEGERIYSTTWTPDKADIRTTNNPVIINK